MNEKKLTFRALVSLIVGSQIGTGAFLLPSSLAGIGSISLFGWLISSSGAILIALVFVQLSLLSSKGGGPHVYIKKAFGDRAAFFVGWTYWVISWVSSVAVILAAVGYLSPLLGVSHPLALLSLEILLITGVTLINLKGTGLVGSMEFYLTILKCSPLIIIPLAGLFFFKMENFEPLYAGNDSLLTCLNTSTLMTFWGFIGLEMANVAAGIVENPRKVVPRAIIMGTLIVATVYIVSSFGIMGLLPNKTLSQSPAPFAEASLIVFGQGWDLVIAVIAFLACLGTLNAWVLASGQVAVEAAKDGLFPQVFLKTNRFGAPHTALLISLCAIIPILIATMSPSILAQLNFIIDISVLTFVFIYLFCMIAYIKISLKEGGSRFYQVLSLLASAFCIWILAFISITNFLWCSFFVLTGVPIYFWTKRNSTSVLEGELGS